VSKQVSGKPVGDEAADMLSFHHVNSHYPTPKSVNFLALIPNYFLLKTIPWMPWSYPENFEAIALSVPEL